MAYRGSCPDMCPESERQTRFGLYMSVFEKDQNNQPDERSMVKEYRRSGADQEEPSPEDLRTPQALELTMDYLVCNILDDSRSKTQELALEWYDFLWDRLRAIRKDITQQNICDQASALLVERCARFHVHSCYAMNRVKNFDVDMNKRNLNDCLQMLRQMYHDLKIMGLQCDGELEFQKYDILLHLNEDHLSSIVLMKTSDYRETKDMKFITQVFNAYTNNQYYKFFQLMKSADYMTACILSLYANKMRLLGLRTIINACAPRQTTLYPALLVMESLGFDDLDDLRSFVSTLELEIQHKEDGSCFLVLNRDILVTIRQGESLIQPYKSKRLIEDKTSGKPVGLLVDGRENLPRDNVKSMLDQFICRAVEKKRAARIPATKATATSNSEDEGAEFEDDEVPPHVESIVVEQQAADHLISVRSAEKRPKRKRDEIEDHEMEIDDEPEELDKRRRSSQNHSVTEIVAEGTIEDQDDEKTNRKRRAPSIVSSPKEVLNGWGLKPKLGLNVQETVRKEEDSSTPEFTGPKNHQATSERSAPNNHIQIPEKPNENHAEQSECSRAPDHKNLVSEDRASTSNAETDISIQKSKRVSITPVDTAPHAGLKAPEGVDMREEVVVAIDRGQQIDGEVECSPEKEQDEPEVEDVDASEDMSDEDEEPFMVERARRVLFRRDIYKREKIADIMPAGCYKVRSLSARLPTLDPPPAPISWTHPKIRKTGNSPQKRLHSLAVSIDDEAKANEIFSQFIQELDNNIST